MKKILYALVLSLIVVSGIAIANNDNKKESPSKASSKPISSAEKKIAIEKWEETYAGRMFREWEASAEGKKVQSSANKISRAVKVYSGMDAVVTSLTLPAGSRLGFGIMVNINGDDYILAFGPENLSKKNSKEKNEFEELHKLKVNDKIIVKSFNVSKAPKYAYPIIAGDYVEQNGKVIYKRVPKNGC